MALALLMQGRFLRWQQLSLPSVPGKVQYNYRVPLMRTKDTVDPKMRDQQAGFRKKVDHALA